MNPSEHWVRERAYYIWEGEGRVAGRAEAHWALAETERAALDAAPTKAKAGTKARTAAKPAAAAAAGPDATGRKVARKAAAGKAAKASRGTKPAAGGLALH